MAIEIGFHRLIVAFHGVVDQVLTRFLGFFEQVSRNFFVAIIGTQGVIIPNHSLHADNVHKAGQGIFRPDRELDRHSLGAQTVANALHGLIEIGTDLVHLIDEHDTRHLIFIGLAPDGFGLRLDPGIAIKHSHSPVEDAQIAFHFDGEIDVAWRVDDVQALILPEGRRGRRSDGDTAFLLLLHPIHRGCAVMDFADLVRLAGIV